MVRLAGWSVAALALILTGCDADRPGRNVVLVTLDTTRADRLGIYGCPETRTPHMDRAGRRGAQFRDAIADVPVTLPSHTTLMTGIPALGHGVRYNADFRVGPQAETLAERLTARGYDTGAVVSALVLDRRFGLDQGFAAYDDDLTPGYVKYDESRYPAPTHWLPKADRRADETVARALAWRDGARAPYFLWVHIYDPHFPFDAPPPWSHAHADPYRAEIQFADAQVGRLLRKLEARGDAPLIVITADHGEGLDQHREDGHGIFIYDETIRVPLLIDGMHATDGVSAGGNGRRPLADPVRTIDIAPTILELSGSDGVPEIGRGQSLAARVHAAPAEPLPPAYSESIKTRLFYSGSGLKALRTERWKYILAPRPELYDLAQDPGETRNLVTEDPRTAARLRSQLDARVGELLAEDLSFVEAVDLDRETAERLASLGYLSGSDGGARMTFVEEMTLVGNDPKDLVDVSMSARDIQNGFVDNAERKLRRFFATARPADADARMARLWAAAHYNYGKIWFDRGDYGRAADEYGRALAADGDYVSARWIYIYSLNLAGRYSQAASEGDRLLAGAPRAWRVRLHRGLALALDGREPDARRELVAVRDGENCPEDIARSAAYYLGRLDGDETPDHSTFAEYLRQ